MRNSRLIGGKPKIGIRPIIDGRRGGIRESLEDMTMAMAHKVAELYSSVLRHSDGTSVECVIADTTIGGVAEAAMAAEKFRNSGVGVVLSVTPCWCYGFETIDMDGEMPKAIWGFNGTERPGAVYLASALASHTQKGLPTFGIYGRDVQEVTNMEIPEDVQEKLLRFARAGIAVATMKGKSYLSIGSVSMGIAGSIPNPDFFQEYLGMRNEYVDASEIERRVQLGIYDHEEFARAMAWTEKYCKKNEGKDFNIPAKTKTREQKDEDWEFIVKMTIIMRDLMQGNPKLREMGFTVFEYETLETEDINKPDDTIGAVEIKNWAFGKGDFAVGDTYEADAIVVLWYYICDEPEPNLTVENCPELAAILSNKAEIDDSYSAFATKYKGRIIEFDGRIDYCTKHENYNTKFDYLVSAGDYDPDHQIGPYFKFENVAYYDLNTNLDTVSVGLNVHIVAEVVSFDSNSGLFYLDPVSVTGR